MHTRGEDKYTKGTTTLILEKRKRSQGGKGSGKPRRSAEMG